MSAPNTTVACNLYDALELICLRGYRLEVILKDGTKRQGIACTLAVRGADGECLQLVTGVNIVWLPLAALATVEVLDSGAPFSRLTFQDASLS